MAYLHVKCAKRFACSNTTRKQKQKDDQAESLESVELVPVAKITAEAVDKIHKLLQNQRHLLSHQNTRPKKIRTAQIPFFSKSWTANLVQALPLSHSHCP